MQGSREDKAVLVCRVGTRLCAWPLDGVDEILRPRPLRTLMAPVDHVPGLARVRGRWVPVVDVAGAVGLGEVPVGRLVVVHHQGQVAALAVTEVTGVQQLDAAALEALPPLLRDGSQAPLDGLATLNEALVALLDPARLMPPPGLEAPADDEPNTPHLPPPPSRADGPDTPDAPPGPHDPPTIQESAA
ncbi:chemotaxis protein CheW [Roseateles depolymerans]|uniref:Putative CheW protein n=1 Tax=Roseateles depolymerans TaxID=76731 RepID=A0A0U3LC84_9BURK|nr:chemotaxis protein CheW [Roseateles depolymerans]ALV05679.1 Putative CheW protein [Roseateles depolymerans]REG13051.1 chemotaxis signal transduction protein [Roseateles depolymerans]